MATLTEIRNKIIKKAGSDQSNIRKGLDEVVVNQRVLAPLCALDIAFGLWQEVQNTPFRHKAKQCANQVQRLWNKGEYSVFGLHGLLYQDMTEDEMALFSDYSDKVAEHTEKERMFLYYFFNGSLMDMPTKERDVCTKILIISVICEMAAANMMLDMNSQFLELERLGKQTLLLAGYYRNNVLGAQDKPLSFINNKQFETTLKVMWNKLLTTPIV